MPLSVFVRDKNNKIQTKQQGGKTVEQQKKFSIRGEFPAEDFGGAKMNLWYSSNFRSALYVPEDSKFDDLKMKLVSYFDENDFGPFYIFEGFVNTRWTLDFLFVNPADADRFGNDWSHVFKAKNDGKMRNVETDVARLRQGFKAQDKRLSAHYTRLAEGFDPKWDDATAMAFVAKKLNVSLAI